MLLKKKTCCFTGHRNLPAKKINHVITRLNEEVDNLIAQGVTDFISGGALGFDQIAASLVIAKKEMGVNVRLIFALPYQNQDENWTAKQQSLYHSLLSEADEIRYISEEYTSDCMKKRNYYMVENSGYCICALIKTPSGTSQTVRYAKEKGLHIINTAR